MLEDLLSMEQEKIAFSHSGASAVNIQTNPIVIFIRGMKTRKLINLKIGLHRDHRNHSYTVLENTGTRNFTRSVTISLKKNILPFNYILNTIIMPYTLRDKKTLRNVIGNLNLKRFAEVQGATEITPTFRKITVGSPKQVLGCGPSVR
jgi:hypothetical protein